MTGARLPRARARGRRPHTRIRLSVPRGRPIRALPRARSPKGAPSRRPPLGDLIRQYLILEQPYYRPTGDEVALFQAAYAVRMPMMLKGPTGCGKTRFIEYMAWRLRKPLVTIACHEDMTGSDLLGRHLLDVDGTHWQDGPLTLAVRKGAICYLDEVVEARQDATVVVHPLADARRVLPLEKNAELVHAHPDFQLVISYNPGYQAAMKDIKQSTRQRFGALDFDWPPRDAEVEIVVHESGVSPELAEKLVSIGERSRNLKGHGLDEGVSTRMLVYAGSLMAQGINPISACDVGLARPVTDDPDVRDALHAAIRAFF
jgi:nitric oxide reductase NorQ protein